MKKILLLLVGLLVILVVVYVVLVSRQIVPLPPFLSPSPTPTQVPIPTPKLTVYPEYLLPTPESLAPSEDPNAYELQPEDTQEFGALMVTLPINTDDYMVYFNFSNSTFEVTVFSDKGMQEYEALRSKYPNIKDESFKVLDQRFGL